MIKPKKTYVLLLVVVSLCFGNLQGSCGFAQTDKQSIAQSGLLPVYAITISLDPAWIDSKQVPSDPTAFPNSGTSNEFQQLWNQLKGKGFNVLRVRVAISDPETVAKRLANLCLWAQNNNVKLLPILTAADTPQTLSRKYVTDVGAFVAALITTLKGNDGQRLAAYSQILAYQLEDDVNHPGLHIGQKADDVIRQVRNAMDQIHSFEETAFKKTDIQSTPLMVSVSMDAELIRAKALAGVPLSDEAYKQGAESLQKLLRDLADIRAVEILNIQWLAGSLSAGGTDRFASLMGDLTVAYPEKKILFTTGFSTAFHSADEQKNYYATTFANLADFRAQKGPESNFIGVVFREALNGAEASAKPPNDKLPQDLAKWDWAARAIALTSMWEGQAPSEELSWWVKKIENNLGIISLEKSGTAQAKLTDSPTGEALQKIETTVSEASASTTVTPPDQAAFAQGQNPGNPNTGTASEFKTALKTELIKGMTGLLDKVFERLGNSIMTCCQHKNDNGNLGGAVGQSGLQQSSSPGNSGTLGEQLSGNQSTQVIDPANNSVAPSADASGKISSTLPNATPTITSIVATPPSIAPASPRVGEMATLSVQLQNPSTEADATGLVVVATDTAGNLLGAETQLPDVTIPRGGTQTVKLNWMPTEARTISGLISVRDAALATEFGKAPFSITVQAPLPVRAEAKGTEGQPLPAPVITNMRPGLPTVFPRGATLSPLIASTKAMIPIPISNPYSRPITNLKAILYVNDRPVGTQNLPVLLPRQARTLTFAGLKLDQTGAQNIRVELKTVDEKTLLGRVATRVQVVKATSPATPSAPPKIASTRPLVDPKIVMGQAAINVSTGAVSKLSLNRQGGTQSIGSGGAGASGTVLIQPTPVPLPTPKPVPMLQSIVPASAKAGGGIITVTIKGANFTNTSKIQWNGSSHATDVTQAKQGILTATMTAAELQKAGTISLAVTNEHGISTPIVFTVQSPSQGEDRRRVSQPGNAASSGQPGGIGSAGSGGIGRTNQPTLQKPLIQAINPSVAVAGGPSFTLTIRGTNFTGTAKIQWKGRDLATNTAQASQGILTATIAATDLQNAGSISVTVANEAITSAPTIFTIQANQHPAQRRIPVLQSITPGTLVAGGASFTLTVRGTNFTQASKIQWNGNVRLTNTTQFLQGILTATIPASDIQNAGTARVTIVNENGISSERLLTIQAKPAVGSEPRRPQQPQKIQLPPPAQPQKPNARP